MRNNEVRRISPTYRNQSFESVIGELPASPTYPQPPQPQLQPPQPKQPLQPPHPPQPLQPPQPPQPLKPPQPPQPLQPPQPQPLQPHASFSLTLGVLAFSLSKT